MSEKEPDKFDKVFENVNASPADADKRKLERVYNEERSNLIKLRQDVGSAITIDKQLEQQLKILKRKNFENGGTELEIANLEHRLSEHRKVKDELKSQLAERELQLQKVYDEKPGIVAALITEPKNIFAFIVLLVIAAALTKLL
ncbi:MAG: hypothetical protein JST89_12695 [Cyanobacteria bacterium SZAS-4]|nr:hypothetical protein [Cyanobacteria bacterium SZAS-4]